MRMKTCAFLVIGLIVSLSLHLASAASASELRLSLLKLLSDYPEGHQDVEIKRKFSALLHQYVEVAEEKNDVLLAIGRDIYGVDFPASSSTAESDGDLCIISFEYMKQFIKDVFISYGVTESNAELCSRVLIESDRRGIDSHGLGRLKSIYCDRMDSGILYPNQDINVISESPTTALVDGNLGLGLYIGPYCMQMAIDKAKKYGVGFVVVQNSTHYGIAGYYSTMATEQGCVGLTGTNARPSIAPTFGVEPMLGTNPLTFGIPTNDPFPFCIDCATSISQRGKIEAYARAGLPTPRGCVIDSDGIERTDTEGILRNMVLGTCCLTPVGGAGDKMGGYKGYGWATTVELLCTAFQSGPIGEALCGIDRETGKPRAMPLGHFFLAIDIEKICPLDVFKENASNLLAYLRAGKKAPNGPGRIWTAGEPEYDAWLQRQSQGGMVVPKPLQANMIELRNGRLGLKEKYPKFPFEA